MATTLKIRLSPLQNIGGEAPFVHVGQTVNFININEGYNIATEEPIKQDYKDTTVNEVALLNYTTTEAFGQNIPLEYGLEALRTSSLLSMSVFRQEIGYEGGEEYDITPLIPIQTEATIFHFTDYNISNDRIYKYVLYPSEISTQTEFLQKESIVHTHWEAWSITELHPVENTLKSFTANPEDVWLFNLNVEPGEQAQNIAKNEQQTLGQFPRYSQGVQNYISGSVSCLLGREVLPVSYIWENGISQKVGGYTEALPFTSKLSSNDKIDMLKAWRKVVYSGNPKLLKDRKGQSFFVTLTGGTNTPMTNIRYQPDTISFQWVEIGSVENITITGNLIT